MSAPQHLTWPLNCCDIYQATISRSLTLTMGLIRHHRSQQRLDNTSLWNEGAAWYQSASLLTHSGSIHNKQDPVVSVSSHSPLLTYMCSEMLSYRASLNSHNANITNRVTGNKRPVTRACLPPSVEHAVLSITILFHPTSAALLAVYFIPVPGGPLRVKCQRPGSSQTRNEYEMIQRGCGKEKRVASKQTELLCH